jgi:hypothetical protein
VDRVSPSHPVAVLQVGALVFGYMVGELVRIIHNLGEHSAYKFRLMTRVRQVRCLCQPVPLQFLRHF